MCFMGAHAGESLAFFQPGLNSNPMGRWQLFSDAALSVLSLNMSVQIKAFSVSLIRSLLSLGWTLPQLQESGDWWQVPSEWEISQIQFRGCCPGELVRRKADQLPARSFHVSSLICLNKHQRQMAHPQDTSNTSGSCLGRSASCIRKQTHWLLLGTLQCVDAVNASFLFCKYVHEWSSLLLDTVLGKMLQAIAMPPLNLCGGMARRRSRVLIRPLGWTVTSMKKSESKV